MSSTTAAAEAGRLVAAATAQLRDAGSPTPRLDAEVLAAHALGRDRSWLLAHPDAPVSEADASALRADVARRAAGEPVAYIRGFKEWLSLRIRTDSRALIPRPETEVLANAAMDEIAARLEAGARTLVAWEVGTGSGAVAVALALRFRRELEAAAMSLVASDVSPAALSLAAENLDAHGVSGLVRLEEADLLAPAGGGLPRPDVVVANLPYLSADEVDAAGRSLAHEPRIALEAGPDGMEVLTRLFGDLADHVARGATVLLETAFGRADAVGALAPPGSAIETLSDLAGVPRVVIVRLADAA